MRGPSPSTCDAQQQYDPQQVEEKIVEKHTEPSTCPPRDLISHSMAFTSLENKSKANRKRKAMEENLLVVNDEDDEFGLSKVPEYDPNWEQLIMQSRQKIKIETFRKNKDWIEYKFNEAKPWESTYTCKFCSRFSKELKIKPKHSTPLMFVQGTYHDDKIANDRTINNHITQVTHEAVLQGVEQMKNIASNKIKYKEKPWHKKTNRVFRTVYNEVLNGNSFRSHTSWMELQELNFPDEEDPLGHRCFSRDMARKIATSISITMHENLVEFLFTNNQPITLIMDSATDNWNNHYM